MVNIDWPEKPLQLCGPGADSGPSDCFKEAREDDTVILRCVASQPGSTEYGGFAYVKANTRRLKALVLASKDGIPVRPSIKSAQSGAGRS
ncbi:MULTISPECIES: hypothetical protein [Aphanothece]|uniref:hypothetical protein n=1 Tax=Aphanothece TaxID=1121 RepID=UPI00398E3A0C